MDAKVFTQIIRTRDAAKSIRNCEDSWWLAPAKLLVRTGVLIYHPYAGRLAPSRTISGGWWTVDGGWWQSCSIPYRPPSTVHHPPPMSRTDANAANEAMVDRMIGQGSLWSPRLIAAFRATPRHL